jgi:hypothetical protein
MKDHPILRTCWSVVNLLLLISIAAVLCSLGWEFSTRSYLKGFSDAIIPAADDPEQKIEAILQWMAQGPARRDSPDPGALAARNPEETLNIQSLLNVCGTASNAFVNIAQVSGLRARRLLLLDEQGYSKHVVVEVLVGGRWIVVDPSHHLILRLADGRPATRGELKDPAVFRAATAVIPGYPQSYTYESTVHVRLSRIPWIGKRLRGIFTRIWPSWEEDINWTLLVERESFAMLVASLLLLGFALSARLLLGWYCGTKLGIARPRFRDQLLRAGQAMAGTTH